MTTHDALLLADRPALVAPDCDPDADCSECPECGACMEQDRREAEDADEVAP